ncbi:MAG: hypothetical protein LDL39_17880, partial [Magnetospirillum sp.]|nr:hypothetical protein [Magnetospirillum sp.]
IPPWDTKAHAASRPKPHKPGNALHSFRASPEWARQYIGGLGSRIDEALKLGAKPSVTAAATQETRNLAWALSKEDGSVARAFANAVSPPDISWLEPLTQIKVPVPAGGPEIGLFDGPSPSPKDKGYQLVSLAGRSAGHPNLAPVTWELGRWLARHMDKPELVKWVIERGCQLHPSWRWLLEQEFPKLAEPWASFWRLLLDGAAEPVHFHRWWDIRLEVRKGTTPPGLDAALLVAAKPYLKASKPFRWGEAASMSPQRLSDLARFELALADADLLHDFLGVADQPPFRALLLGLADPLTSRMADAMRLLQAGGSYIGGMSDRFSLIRQDDLRAREYPALAWLCVRALTIALEEQPAKALSLARRWMDLWRLDRLYLFRRMALHALGLGALDHPDEEVEFLLAENGQVLWAYDCEPELGRYLAERAPRLPLLILNRLREAVIAGPTEQSIPGCTADHLAEYSAEKISRRLGKLREGAVIVPLPTEEQPEDMGDVQTVRVVHRGPDSDRADDLLELSPEAVADALLAADGRFSASRQLADLCTRKPELALACVPLLAEQRDGGWEGWGGLNELARVPNPAPALATIARVTADYPQLAKGTLLWALAQIMQGWGGQAGSDTAFRTDYLNVWRYLWHAATLEGPDEVRDNDKLDITINHPAGILAEAMVDLIISLPDDEAGDLFGDLDAMARAGGQAAHHARVIVASRLLWIHRLFPDWTARTIVPCMDHTSPDAVSLWQGYFWGGRWDIPLMEALAPAFLSMRGGFDERQLNGTWNDMLADILMEAPGLLSAHHVSRVMRDADEEDLQAMARHFSIRLDAAKEKAGELWLKAIRPIMDSIWPAATARHTSPVVETLVRMALRCREQFSNAVTLLERRRLLRPLDRDHAILLHLDRDNGELPDYCAIAPDAVLLLLSRTIGHDLDSWEAKDLGAVLKRLIEARPDFAERLEFRALEATAAKAGL